MQQITFFKRSLVDGFAKKAHLDMWRLQNTLTTQDGKMFITILKQNPMKRRASKLHQASHGSMGHDMNAEIVESVSSRQNNVTFNK